jgi:nitroimidazol reductase NimA-like FMN-containing flavoprotein (pyridoxamine 5'-phosphate oxidase superfamily)
VIRDRPGTVELDEFLARPLFAHLATASDDGPRESPVWFLWDDEAIWIIGSRRTDSFPARLEREPRCAIGIVDFDAEWGLVQHVGMRGHATTEPFDADRARRLLARYLGDKSESWDRRFRETLGDPDNLFVRVVPETVVARDISYGQGERREGKAGPDGSSSNLT